MTGWIYTFTRSPSRISASFRRTSCSQSSGYKKYPQTWWRLSKIRLQSLTKSVKNCLYRLLITWLHKTGTSKSWILNTLRNRIKYRYGKIRMSGSSKMTCSNIQRVSYKWGCSRVITDSDWNLKLRSSQPFGIESKYWASLNTSTWLQRLACW